MFFSEALKKATIEKAELENNNTLANSYNHTKQPT